MAFDIEKYKCLNVQLEKAVQELQKINNEISYHSGRLDHYREEFPKAQRLVKALKTDLNNLLGEIDNYGTNT